MSEMNDKRKQAQLIKELRLRRQVSRFQEPEKQRKWVEEALWESEERYRTILEEIEEGYYEIDVAGNFTFVNDALCGILGYAKDELLGMNNRQYMDDVNAKRVYRTFSTVYQTGKPAKAFDWEVIGKDGARIPVEASVSLMTDPAGGESVGFRGIVRDITERVRSKEERARAEADSVKLNRELAALNKVGQALISALDLQETLTVITDHATQLLGVAAASVVLHDEAQGDLCFAAASGEGSNFIRHVRLPLGQGVAGWVIQRGEPVMVPDVLKEPRFFGDFDQDSGLMTRSILCVPLQSKGRTIGAIEVMNKESGTFDEEDLRLLTSLAAPAATAIESARLFEQSQARAKELAVLNELSQALTARLSVEEVLDEAYRQVARLVDTTNFYIGLYDPEKDEVAIPFHVSKSEIDRQITVIPADQGLTGYIVRNRTSVLVGENVTEWLEEKGMEPVGEPALSWLGVPLTLGDHVLGVMAVQSYTVPRLYDEHDRDLLMAIAGPTAIAIQNARLFQAEQEQRELAEALEAASVAISSTLHLDQVLDHILEQVERVIPGDAFSIELVEGSATRMVRWRGYERVDMEGLDAALPIADYPNLVRMSQSGKPAVVPDTATDPDWLLWEGWEWVRSYVGAPVQVAGETVAFLNVDGTRPGQFGPADARRLQSFANQAAAAIQNARLYEQAQREIAERIRSEEEQARAEEALRESEKKYRVLVNTSVDGIISIDPQMNVTLWNRGAERIFGYTEAEMLGQALVKIVPERYREAKDRGFAEFKKYGSGPVIGRVLELYILRKDGTEVPVELSISSRKVGGTYVATAIARDVTDRKQAEEALQEAHAELERRTSILERRTVQLQAAAEVAREATAILDVQQLLDETVYLISDRFGFYHAGVFLLDERSEYAILRAASSEGGQRMLERGHSLKAGEVGIVGYVAGTGKPRIALDVGEDTAHFAHADLPDTRSEMALPLMVRGHIIGALDVQSTEPGAFTEEDVVILQTMADQLAVAIENARLMERTAAQVRELSRLYGEYSAAAWAGLTSSERPLSYVYDRIDVLPADESPTPALDVALERGETVSLVEQEAAVLAIPLKVRDQVIGSLGVQQTDGVREWSPEEIALVQAVGDQVAIALENARLFEETQQRAGQWEALTEVGRAIGSILNLDEVLQLILEQLKQVVPYDSVALWLQEGEDMRIRAARGFESDIGLAVPIREDVLFQELMRTQQPLIIADARQDERFRGLADTEWVCSWLGVPLLSKGEVIGLLTIDKNIPNFYTAETAELAFAFSQQVAMALENARLFEEAQRRATQLAAAAEVSRDAAAILDVDQLLDETVQLISEQFGFYHAGVFLLDEWDRYAVLQAASSEGGRRMLERGHRLRVGEIGIVGYVASTGEHRITLDVGEDAAHFAHADLPDTRSEMALPLKVRGRVIGVLDVQSTEENAFSEEDVATLQTMADQLATAITNARLFQDTRDDAVRRALINEVLQAAAASLNPEELLHRAGEVISHRLGVPSAVFIWEQEQQVLCLVAAHAVDATDISFPGGSQQVTRGMNPVLFEVVKERRPRVLESAEAIRGPLAAAARQAQVESAIYAPLVSRDKVLGVLALGKLKDQPLVEAEFIELVAANLSVALENAYLYQDAVYTAEKLAEADRLKSQFLANMSHELRTPLNSIIGFSRVILKEIDGPLTDMQRTDLEAVYDSGQHLLGLINDILDISKIEAGKMELAFEAVDLKQIIVGVMATAKGMLKDKPAVELQQVIPIDLPTIRGDERRIRQVLINLVSNAEKFTEEGFIRVEAVASSTEVIVSVTDSGIGIPQDQMESIFEPFTQVDASTTRRAGGTGLGLSITSRFVEMHDGRMWVESELGKGSTFYFALPIGGILPPSEKVEMEVKQSEPGPEQKVVLCVEDDEGVITLFRRYLSKQGYRVVGLTDSTAVVEQARQLRPFAITLDVMMPVKDGWQVVQELKSDPETCHIPVIMCTIVAEKEHGLSLGASGYLVKPVLEQELLAALERLDQRDGHHLVLVVDDHAEDRALLRRVIEACEGYEVVEASGGQEAIALIRQTRPHVIVLDLMMPEVDGFAVLEAVKADEATRSIPIIVVTAKDLSEEERGFLNRGVEALLQKGIFEQQELLADVAAALERLSHVERIE